VLELHWNATCTQFSYIGRVSLAGRETGFYREGKTEAKGVYEQGVEGEYLVKGRGKAIPLQTLTGPEGSRSLRLPDFKTIGT
jgi:hypothetical protein